MLQEAKAFSGFSVSDIPRAKEFYGDTLGLDARESPEGLQLHLAGGTSVFLYESKENTPANYTILNFIVGDIAKAVSELQENGIRLEQYDMPGIKTDENGISHNESGMGPKAMAWFKDPDGHILSVLQE